MTEPASSSERRRRVVIAGHTGDHGTARRHLDDADPSVRASAIAALIRTGALTPGELTDALVDPDPEVRRRTVELAPTVPPDARVDLLPLLDDEDDRVVEVTAWALGEQAPPDQEAVPRLCELAADHRDSLVREAAVASLGAIGDARAIETILAATTDIATVRRRAVIALAPFEGAEVDAALARARSDRDWQVRQAAEDLADPPAPTNGDS